MAEDALRRREDYLRLTIDTIPEAVGDAELTSMLRPKIEFQIGGDATQRTSKTL